MDPVQQPGARSGLAAAHGSAPDKPELRPLTATTGASECDDIGPFNPKSPIFVVWDPAGHPPLRDQTEKACGLISNAASANFTASTVDRLEALVLTRLKRLPYLPTVVGGFLTETGAALDPLPSGNEVTRRAGVTCCAGLRTSRQAERGR